MIRLSQCLVPSAARLALLAAVCVSSGCNGMFRKSPELVSLPPWYQSGTATPEPQVEPVEEAEEVEELGETRKKRFFFFPRSKKEDAVEEVLKPNDPAPPPVSVQGPKSAYRVKVGDLVVVTLEGPGGLKEQTEEEVDERGVIRLRYIGDVPAAGKTTTVLEREIEKVYVDKEIYRRVMARVKVLNRFYFIGGEVKNGGRYPLVGEISLSQAVIAAGNFTEWANPKKIILVRNNVRQIIDFREIRTNPENDVKLKAGDSITVSRGLM